MARGSSASGSSSTASTLDPARRWSCVPFLARIAARPTPPPTIEPTTAPFWLFPTAWPISAPTSANVLIMAICSGVNPESAAIGFDPTAAADGPFCPPSVPSTRPETCRRTSLGSTIVFRRIDMVGLPEPVAALLVNTPTTSDRAGITTPPSARTALRVRKYTFAPSCACDSCGARTMVMGTCVPAGMLMTSGISPGSSMSGSPCGGACAGGSCGSPGRPNCFH